MKNKNLQDSNLKTVRKIDILQKCFLEEIGALKPLLKLLLQKIPISLVFVMYSRISRMRKLQLWVQ